MKHTARTIITAQIPNDDTKLDSALDGISLGFYKGGITVFASDANVADTQLSTDGALPVHHPTIFKACGITTVAAADFSPTADEIFMLWNASRPKCN